MIVSDEFAIQHLRADSDGDDMPLIQLYLSAAEQVAIEFLNRMVYHDQDALDAAVADGIAGEMPMVANDAIQAAILLTLGHLYGNREDVVLGVTAVELPRGSRSLLQPYRVGMGV